ncbi:MAG: OsmC family protein [Candidatus Limnocylindrales bacterium]
MGSDEIRQAIQAATDYLRQNPDEARYTDSAATASLVRGLVVRVTGSAGESVTTDMSPSVGGTAAAPSPGWLLRAAEASCVATLIAMRAAMMGITLDALEVVVDSESDDRGILGMDETVPPGPLSGRVMVRLGAQGVERATLEAVAAWGIRHCPVHDALARPVLMTTRVATD